MAEKMIGCRKFCCMYVFSSSDGTKSVEQNEHTATFTSPSHLKPGKVNNMILKEEVGSKWPISLKVLRIS